MTRRCWGRGLTRETGCRQANSWRRLPCELFATRCTSIFERRLVAMTQWFARGQVQSDTRSEPSINPRQNVSTQSPGSSGVKKRGAKRSALGQDELRGFLLSELQKGGPALTSAAAVRLAKAAGETTTPAAVSAAFELLAGLGRVHRHPGATAKSAPAYGLQSATELVAQGVSNAFKTGTEHSLTTIRASAPKAYTGLVDEEIGRLVREGKLFQLPGKTPKFTTQSPQAVVVRALDNALTSGTEHSLTSLRKAVPKDYKGLVDEELARRVREGKLFQLPGKTPKYTTQRARPTSVLTAPQRKSLEIMLGKVNPLRSRALSLDELLEFLDGTGALPLQTTSSSSVPALPAQPAAKPARAPTLPWLEQLYRHDLPARGGLTSMPIPWTWRRYVAEVEAEGGAPDRAAFERTLMEARAQGRVEITPHERPTALSPEELTAAFRQPLGLVLYYWRPIRVQ